MKYSKASHDKNKHKSKDKYENIKADYFLELLFNNLSTKRTLDIIKYNKRLKKRTNININIYKEFSSKYSSIEIEIIPGNNKFGKFINFKKEDEKYFHIFFNDSKEEIKRNYTNKYDEAKKIKIIINYPIKSFKNLFDECKSIESIYFKQFIRNNINNMSGMFYRCLSLKDINFSNFNTENVKDMAGMFSWCTSLKKLDLSNFNTQNVKNMWSMFSDCSNLEEINLSNFNTDNTTNMGYMFSRCSSLKEVNFSNFNTDKVNNMYGMFYKCSNQFQTKIRENYENIKDIAFISVF